MRSIKKAFLTLLAIIVVMISADAASRRPEPRVRPEAGVPDFAFPEKVEALSRKDLAAALKSADEPAAVEAIVKLSIAQAVVSADSIPVVLKEIADVEASLSSPAAKALLQLLRARIYSELYSADKYRIDRRETIESSDAPVDDYTIWSKKQFYDRVLSLCNQALEARNDLQATVIGFYSDVITISNNARVFYPTLWEFATSQAIAVLNAFDEHNPILSPSLLADPTFAQNLPPSGVGNPTADILHIYNLWTISASTTPAAINARCKMISFVDSHTFGDKDSFDILISEYQKSDSEYAAQYLLDVPFSFLGSERRSQYYNLLCEFQSQHPNYFNINAVTNRISEISAKDVQLTYPQQIGLSSKWSVDVHATNVGKVTINIYDVTPLANPDKLWLNSTVGGRLVASKTIEFDGATPFTGRGTVEFDGLPYGYYLAMADFVGMQPENVGRSVICCSDLSIGVTSGGGKTVPYVVDAYTGAPVEGAKVLYKSWSRDQAVSYLKGATDRNGFMPADSLKRGDVRPQFLASDDIYAPFTSYYTDQRTESEDMTYGDIFTSLALYRPGDTLQFCAVVYNHRGFKGAKSARENTPASKTKVLITLRNANYEEIDTLQLVTDAMGRVSGSFLLPTDGLTGSFTIQASVKRAMSGWRRVASRSVMVSDYKLPTFAVQSVVSQRPAVLGDSAVISGSAETFAGFPLDNANVRLQLKVRTGFWWWAHTSPVFYEATAKTNDSGKFEIVIPAPVIQGSPCATGVFIADISVSSPDGETQQSSASFNMGKPFSISVNIPATYEIGASKASVMLTDFAGNNQTGNLRYTIKKVDEQIFAPDYADAATEIAKEGTCSVGDISSVLNTLAPGVYRFEFSAPDDDADNATTDNIVVWKRSDTACPVAKLLWLPDNKVVADAEGCATLLYGTAVDQPHILATISDALGNIISMQWLSAHKGMNKFNVYLDKNGAPRRVYLSIVSNFHSQTAWADVVSVRSLEAIEVHTSTFRDRVTPGASETITFKVSPKNGASTRCALIADMSNKAIEMLRPNNLFLLAVTNSIRRLWMNGLSFSTWQSSWYHSNKYLDIIDINSPEFNLYGQDFVQPLFYRHNLYYSMGLAKSMANDSYDECAEADSATGMVGDLAEETAVTESSADDAGAAVAQQPSEQSAYRPSEIPLAFFRPLITTNDDGSFELTYTVPDANTTWVLKTLAYNDAMLASTDQVEIVASKPLMVSLNNPRFLRCGDTAVIQASVMNNTDSFKYVHSVIEVLNPADNSVLCSSLLNVGINAMQRKVLSINLNVPSDVSAVIVRVKADADATSDGEQALVPILPSQQQVVESQMFFIAPDDPQFVLPIQASSGDVDRTYLRFTENPTWEVVSALPGLRQNKIESSVEAAAALFSAAVADGLCRENPDIVRALRRWAENPSDSALVSQLQKNEQLKQIILSATPWVADAQSQTERMQRLVLLLDRANNAKIISSAINDLAKLQASDGGWMWCKSYPQSSVWATEHVLEMLGDLNMLGYMPDSKKLQQMLNSAINFYDKETATQFAKYPRADYTVYCYIRKKLPEYKQSTAAKKVTSTMVQRIIADWKNHSLVIKAVDAQILKANGYSATAKNIIESLRQYATVTPQKGMWWQKLDDYTFFSMDKVGCTAIILDAFVQVDPACTDIDKIRQWLILSKTNCDWGQSILTTQVVTSVLNSGSKVKINPTATAIHINDELLRPSSVEFATGEFTENITPMLPPNQQSLMVIDRQANYPSCGALISFKTLPITDLKAAGCDELKIAKQLSVFRDGQWYPTDEFKVGDLVKVVLTLRVDADMDYVVIEDERAATLEPVNQLPTPIWCDGLCFYRENRDAQTNIFIDHLPRGTYMLEYDMFATQAGVFASGAAKSQSQYNPNIAAHSAGATLMVE